jgi:hypothetical protein
MLLLTRPPNFRVKRSEFYTHSLSLTLQPDFLHGSNPVSNSQSTGTATVPKMVFFKHIARILLFYFVGISIFFISGFVVFKVLFADTEQTVVPDVVGRLFLGEHNKLRDDFKVDIKPAYLIQYPYGYILAQDVAPGKRVDKNTKLELLVNLSDAVVQVPKLVGFSEDLVDGSLASLPVGGRVFALRKGVITRVPSAQPKREVLAQFPLPGTPVVPNTPVALLISDGPQGLSVPQANLRPRIEKGTPVSIAMSAAYHVKIPAAITLTKTEVAGENGHLMSDAKLVGNELQLEVGDFTEILQKGKSRIPLAELPFVQLLIPEKKLGAPGAILTVARREPIAMEDGSFYSEYYLIKNQAVLPVFRRRVENFDIYAERYEPPAIKPVVTSKDEAGTKTIVGETEKSEPVVKIQKPEKSLHYEAETL